jgi:hypothetical protein
MVLRCESLEPPHVSCGSHSALLRHPLNVWFTPRKRPYSGHRSTSQTCQRATYAVAANSAYSITSSARASSVAGMSTPSIRAVCPLMTSSNLADCTTGKSAGLAPLRMRPVYTPSCRYVSTMSGSSSVRPLCRCRASRMSLAARGAMPNWRVAGGGHCKMRLGRRRRRRVARARMRRKRHRSRGSCWH